VNAETYTPHGKTAKMLERALEVVNSVPYNVSTRWLFYRMLQEGYYSKKSDYRSQFCKATASARRACWGGWRPDTLVDDTREPIVRGDGFASELDWLRLVQRAECQLDKWFGQEYYVELWYEARAMSQQFKYYTDYMTLRPLGGQPSIEYKYRAAKALEAASARYAVPIVVLYFGDLDTAGGIISDVVERDVRLWCEADFQFIRCGLTLDQVRRYNVPENFEKPGEFQWEALSDDGAHQIITDAAKPFLRQVAFSSAETKEQRVTRWLRDELAHLAERWAA